MEKILDFAAKERKAKAMTDEELGYAIQDCEKCITANCDPAYYADEASVYRRELQARSKKPKEGKRLEDDKFFEMLKNSEAVEEATEFINGIVEEANRKGLRLTAEQRDRLREMRIFYIILKDKEVFKAVASEVYNVVKAREAKA